MGSKSSTRQVRKRDPEPAELTSLRNNLYGMLSPIISGNYGSSGAIPGGSGEYDLGVFDAAGNKVGGGANAAGGNWANTAFGSDWLKNRQRVDSALNQYDALSKNTQPLMDKVLGASEELSGVSGKIEGVGDRQSGLSDEILNFTRTGSVPAAVLDNLNRAVNSELNKNTGSALNDLAARGVMNSSVANRSLGGLADSAADAYAKNYLNAFNSVLSGYGQTNSALAGTADTYAKAAGGLNSALTGYGKALDTNSAMMKQAGSMPQTLTQAMMSQYEPVYQFWKDWQNSYDNREDYDTIVKQGK